MPTILVFKSNPRNTIPLDLGKEYRAIDEGLKHSHSGNKLQLQPIIPVDPRFVRSQEDRLT